MLSRNRTVDRKNSYHFFYFCLAFIALLLFSATPALADKWDFNTSWGGSFSAGTTTPDGWHVTSGTWTQTTDAVDNSLAAVGSAGSPAMYINTTFNGSNFSFDFIGKTSFTDIVYISNKNGTTNPATDFMSIQLTSGVVVSCNGYSCGTYNSLSSVITTGKFYRYTVLLGSSTATLKLFNLSNNGALVDSQTITFNNNSLGTNFIQLDTQASSAMWFDNIILASAQSSSIVFDKGTYNFGDTAQITSTVGNPNFGSFSYKSSIFNPSNSETVLGFITQSLQNPTTFSFSNFNQAGTWTAKLFQCDINGNNCNTLLASSTASISSLTTTGTITFNKAVYNITDSATINALVSAPDFVNNSYAVNIFSPNATIPDIKEFIDSSAKNPLSFSLPLNKIGVWTATIQTCNIFGGSCGSIIAIANATVGTTGNVSQIYFSSDQNGINLITDVAFMQNFFVNVTTANLNSFFYDYTLRAEFPNGTDTGHFYPIAVSPESISTAIGNGNPIGLYKFKLIKHLWLDPTGALDSVEAYAFLSVHPRVFSQANNIYVSSDSPGVNAINSTNINTVVYVQTNISNFDSVNNNYFWKVNVYDHDIFNEPGIYVNPVVKTPQTSILNTNSLSAGIVYRISLWAHPLSGGNDTFLASTYLTICQNGCTVGGGGGGLQNTIATTKPTYFDNETEYIFGYGTSAYGTSMRVIIVPQDNQNNIFRNYPVSGSFNLGAQLFTGSYTAILQDLAMQSPTCPNNQCWSSVAFANFDVVPSGANLSINFSSTVSPHFTYTGNLITVMYTNVTATDLVQIDSPSQTGFLVWNVTQYPYSHSFIIPNFTTSIGTWHATIINSSNSSNTAQDYLLVNEKNAFVPPPGQGGQGASLQVSNTSICTNQNVDVSWVTTNLTPFQLIIYNSFGVVQNNTINSPSGTVSFVFGTPDIYTVKIQDKNSTIWAIKQIQVTTCIAPTIPPTPCTNCQNQNPYTSVANGNLFILVLIVLAFAAVGFEVGGFFGSAIGFGSGFLVASIGGLVPLWAIYLFALLVIGAFGAIVASILISDRGK